MKKHIPLLLSIFTLIFATNPLFTGPHGCLGGKCAKYTGPEPKVPSGLLGSTAPKPNKSATEKQLILALQALDTRIDRIEEQLGIGTPDKASAKFTLKISAPSAFDDEKSVDENTNIQDVSSIEIDDEPPLEAMPALDNTIEEPTDRLVIPPTDYSDL